MAEQLIRDSLQSVIRKTDSVHAGLLLNRGLSIWQNAEDLKKYVKDQKQPEKSKLVAKVCAVKPSELYKKAFDRWVSHTAKAEQFSGLSVKLEHRLFIGLATGGAIETGVSTQHTYGMPMIAGSAVKGAAHSYAESIGLEADVLAVLFGEDEDSAKKGNRIAGAGCLVWHDAWWYPNDATLPFVAEVVTVHHQDYYGGRGDATDFDSPIPNQQVAVQGSFYFVIEGDQRWSTFAKQLLKSALEQHGLGAKTAAGYGYFAESDKMTKAIQKTQGEALVKGIDDPLAKLRHVIKNLSEDELVQGLTKDKKKFKDAHGFEDWQTVYALVKECHSSWVESWRDSPKKSNKETAFKALNKAENQP